MRCKACGLIAGCLLVLAGFAGGYCFNKYLASRRTSYGADSPPPEHQQGQPGPSDTQPPGKASLEASGDSLSEIEEQILRLSGGDWRRGGDRKLRRALDSVELRDMPRALLLIDKALEQHTRSSLRQLLLSRWAETDPRAAMASAQAVRNRAERESAISAVLGGWADKDPESAVAWVKKLPPGELKIQALTEVISSSATSNPQLALDLLRSSPTTDGRQWTWIRDLFGAWASRDPATAAAKVTELSSSQARSEAYVTVGSIWARNNPQSAIAWASCLPDQNGRQSALTSVLTEWARSDADAALAWAQQLPTGQTKQQALSALS